MNLYNKQGTQKLLLNTSKQINSGGEGAIYEHPTNKHLVVKIYHPGITPNVTEDSVNELNKLTSHFISPEQIVYDNRGKILGYTMEYIDTKGLTLLSNIYNKANALKFGFTEKIKKDLFYRITSSVMAAHQNGVVIGDLNPYNVFVGTKSGDVYFIDVDSFQTKGRKHSGVILPEVRDWINNDVTEKSDYYALAVMAFNMFTYVHPFKGVHKAIKSLEERVVKHLSVLSGDKDIIIPSFYEEITDFPVRTQFEQIFHHDLRFPVSLDNIKTAMTTIAKTKAVVTKVAGITVFKVSDGVMEFYSVESRFYIKSSPNVFEVYTCDTHGAVKVQNRHFDTQAVYLGEKGAILYTKGRLMTEDLMPIKNYQLPYNYSTFQKNGEFMILDNETDSYSILHLNKMNGAVPFDTGVIYAKSIDIQDELIQSISNQKWIVDISSGFVKTIRTKWNIKNAYIDGDVGCMEFIVGAAVEYNLFRVDGLTINTYSNCVVPEFRYITQKGDYVYVPEEGYISVRSKIDFREVLQLECPQVSSQSRLKSVKAGILCLTQDVLYLINKNN